MKKSVRNIGKILGITLAVYISIRWLLPLIFPFFIAFLFAKLLNPIVEKLNKIWNLKRGIVSSILVGVFVILAGTGIVIFVITFLEQIKNIIANMDEYRREAGAIWENCCIQIQQLTGIQAGKINDNVEKVVPMLTENLKSSVLPSLMGGTLNSAKNVFIFFGIFLITIISTILILKDYHKIKTGLARNPIGKISLRVSQKAYEAGGAYIKAQLIIMFVMTIICVAGLYLSGNSYALLAGCSIGVCDALPFLGTGTIFVPWAIIEIIQGKYMAAAIYAAIYAVCSLVREIMEPKLLGNKLGMHPLAVIASIYVGLNIYGLLGFALGPLSYILIREIYSCTV